jgi:hypothetical protein
MYFDGSYTLKGAEAGVVVIPPEGDVLKYAIQLEFSATNNIVEYEELVNDFRLAKDLDIRRLLINGLRLATNNLNSQLPIICYPS